MNDQFFRKPGSPGDPEQHNRDAKGDPNRPANEADKRQQDSGLNIQTPEMPAISLPKGGGAIQGMGEKFQANPVTGSGTFTVPLTISPGRAGFGPQLSLSYDSGSGNGPFGLGWQIGLPSIMRKTQKGLPEYRDADESDTFVLSGSEDLVPALKKVGVDWVPDVVASGVYTITRYRPRTEGQFSRIERWEDRTTGISHWRTVSSANVTTVLGESAAARVAHPDHPERVYQWMVEKTYDEKGNIVLYEYKKEDGEGVSAQNLAEKSRVAFGKAYTQTYLKRVLYGNSKMFSPTDATFFSTTKWNFRLVFDYGEHALNNPTTTEVNKWEVRQDPFSTFRPGFEVRNWRLCKRILMFHHFAELGVDPVLVKSTNLAFDENAVTAQLTSATHWGYAQGQAPASLPAMEFKYSGTDIDTQLHHFDVEDLENLPAGVDGSEYQWVDLNGEGLSGVLAGTEAGWYFKRNLGDENYYADYPVGTEPPQDVRFGPIERIATKPMPGDGQQLTDLDGDGKLELVIRSGPVKGYFQLGESEEWERFHAFEGNPSISMDDPNLRFIDLDGDGFADILITETDCLTWHRSLSKKGYAEGIRVSAFRDEATGPAIVFADGSESIHLADMSGDGLQDIVRVRNGEVCYWPNLGFARFGAQIQMENAPLFDHPDKFSQGRIRLSDVDGSGATDIVYLGDDAITWWSNQSGNGWALGHEIQTFPKVDSMATVSVMDLFGTGTGCIVWSTPLPGDVPYRIRYINLLKGKKPYLLAEANNNMGAIRRFHYAPSTKYYVRDRQEGRPWVTKLAFPVQVLERSEVYDEVTGVRFVSRYAYHHGYFDGPEREFRGFGLVEQWDSENYEAFNTPGLFQVGSNALSEASHVAPVYTKTWFHNGAYFSGKTISRQYESEYFSGDPAAWLLEDMQLPTGMTAIEEREAARALKGSVLRVETYGLDGDAAQDVPYSVAETSYDLRRLQPRAGEKFGVFQLIPKEALTYTYERKANDPRIGHELTLEVDVYGNVLKKAVVAYPRRVPVYAEQGELRITVNTSEYINVDSNPAFYRLGVQYFSRSYELTGVTYASAKLNLASLLSDFTAASDIAFEVLPSGISLERRLLTSAKALFYKDDLSGPLALGQVASHALPYQTFQATFTAGLVYQAYNNDGTTRVTNTILANEGKYVLDSGLWWTPSDRASYDGLRFYQVIQLNDPYGNSSAVTYDSYNLFPIEVVDPLGNTLRGKYDYRVLQPWESTDANGNRKQLAFDVLDMISKTVVLGKVGETDPSKMGDTLSDPTSRLVYDLFNWQVNRQPIFVHAFGREKHGVANPRWQESFEYSNGLGQMVLSKIQAEPGMAYGRNPDGTLKRDLGGDLVLEYSNPRWIGSGRIIQNNKGNAVKQYEPYFSSTEDYEDEAELREYGVSPVTHYDPLARETRTDLPDGSFTKTIFDCWTQNNFDNNDTVMDSQWYLDRNSPLPGGPEPTDPDERAAWLAAQHQDTSQTIHLDNLGRPFLQIDDNGVYGNYSTKSVLDIQDNQVGTVDAKSRALTTTLYSMTAQPVRVEHLDSGKRRVLLNVMNNPIRSWDDRGHALRNEYDGLHRLTHNWVDDNGAGEKLVTLSVYGVVHPTPESFNFRGQLVLQYDQSGLNQTREYDFKGNPIATVRQFAVNYKTTVDWAALSTLTNFSSILSTAAPLLESETFTSTTKFDALNRATELALPDTSVVRPSYNEANLLDKLDAKVRGAAAWTPFVTNVDYDAKGQRALVSYGNNTQTRYTYDPLTYRLTRLRTIRGNDNAVLQDLQYTFDPVGNITEIKDDAQQTVFFNNAVVSPNSKFVYDPIYRLLSATGREHAGGVANAQYDQIDFPINSLPHVNNATAVRAYTQRFQYDELGNMLKMMHVATGGSWTRGYRHATANNFLEATSLPGDTVSNPATYSAAYTYDAHGNMASMPHLLDLSWDFQDQLKDVDLGGGGKAYYVYSGGERVRKVIENGSLVKDRLYLNAIEIYRERVSGSLKLERESLHVSDDTGRFCLVETETVAAGAAIGSPTPLHRYQYGNHLGSCNLELDHDALIITYEEYHPFGTSAYRSGRTVVEVQLKRYRYTGKEKDEESGLYYFGARYHLAWLGRFASVDPRKDDYPSQSSYVYAANNPVKYVDVNGEGPGDGPDKFIVNEELAGSSQILDDGTYVTYVSGNPEDIEMYQQMFEEDPTALDFNNKAQIDSYFTAVYGFKPYGWATRGEFGSAANRQRVIDAFEEAGTQTGVPPSVLYTFAVGEGLIKNYKAYGNNMDRSVSSFHLLGLDFFGSGAGRLAKTGNLPAGFNSGGKFKRPNLHSYHPAQSDFPAGSEYLEAFKTDGSPHIRTGEAGGPKPMYPVFFKNLETAVAGASAVYATAYEKAGQQAIDLGWGPLDEDQNTLYAYYKVQYPNRDLDHYGNNSADFNNGSVTFAKTFDPPDVESKAYNRWVTWRYIKLSGVFSQ